MFNIASINVINTQNGVYKFNTGKCVHIMEHWILLYINKQCLIYFESFTRSPIVKDNITVF